MSTPLDRLRVPTPCAADWGRMAGGDRARHCALCNRTVHDLSAMTEAEALAVVGGAAPACVRFRRRADGRVVTRPAPPTVQQKGVMTAVLAALLAASTVATGRLVDAFRPAAPDLGGMGAEVMGEVLPPDDWAVDDLNLPVDRADGVAVLGLPAPPPPVPTGPPTPPAR